MQLTEKDLLQAVPAFEPFMSPELASESRVFIWRDAEEVARTLFRGWRRLPRHQKNAILRGHAILRAFACAARSSSHCQGVSETAELIICQRENGAREIIVRVLRGKHDVRKRILAQLENQIMSAQILYRQMRRFLRRIGITKDELDRLQKHGITVSDLYSGLWAGRTIRLLPRAGTAIRVEVRSISTFGSALTLTVSTEQQTLLASLLRLAGAALEADKDNITQRWLTSQWLAREMWYILNIVGYCPRATIKALAAAVLMASPNEGSAAEAVACVI